MTKIETGIILSIRDRLAVRMRECVCVYMCLKVVNVNGLS